MKPVHKILLFAFSVPLSLACLESCGGETTPPPAQPQAVATPAEDEIPDTFSVDTDSLFFNFQNGTSASQYYLQVLPSGPQYDSGDLPIQVNYLGADENKFVIVTKAQPYGSPTTFCLMEGVQGCPDSMVIETFKSSQYSGSDPQAAVFGLVGVVDLRGTLRIHQFNMTSCNVSLNWTDNTLVVGTTSTDCISIYNR